ncbi:uncharacterized protein LOC132301624 [Cornus florida]|uniref:uncharacterized protein LOC132301624 n=1 Tax=Cornus florida TaxID=4283 RepID=UPI0028A1FE88|nr:uncharacterized protein LOC132301624 [Cornus florida]
MGVKSRCVKGKILYFLCICNGGGWVSLDVLGCLWPVDDGERHILWEELGLMRVQLIRPRCIGGDFNVVRSPAERSIGGRWTSAMVQFLEFIDGHHLHDLLLQGATLTWGSGRNLPTFSRLDRFLIFGDWEEKFPDAIQVALARPVSDHFPLVLDCGEMRSRITPFQFKNIQLRADDFQGYVRNWWEGSMIDSFLSYVLARKLRVLKNEIKRWNKEVFGNLEWRKNRAFAEIAHIDRLEGSSGIGEEQTSRRVACQAEITKIAMAEEISWRQKSRAILLKEGDRNTKFFHRLANAQRRGNHIGRLNIEGETLIREEDVCKGVSTFNQGFFTENTSSRPRLDDLHFDSISEASRIGLETPFSEEEVMLQWGQSSRARWFCYEVLSGELGCG